MVEEDSKAKKSNGLIGRFIAHPFADGSAFYKITKVTKRTVTIEVITGIGDDWVLPAWGEKCTIPLATAFDFVSARDELAELFKKN